MTEYLAPRCIKCGRKPTIYGAPHCRECFDPVTFLHFTAIADEVAQRAPFITTDEKCALCGGHADQRVMVSMFRVCFACGISVTWDETFGRRKRIEVTPKEAQPR